MSRHHIWKVTLDASQMSAWINEDRDKQGEHCLVWDMKYATGGFVFWKQASEKLWGDTCVTWPHRRSLWLSKRVMNFEHTIFLPIFEKCNFNGLHLQWTPVYSRTATLSPSPFSRGWSFFFSQTPKPKSLSPKVLQHANELAGSFISLRSPELVRENTQRLHQWEGSLCATTAYCAALDRQIQTWERHKATACRNETRNLYHEFWFFFPSFPSLIEVCLDKITREPYRHWIFLDLWPFVSGTWTAVTIFGM